MYDTNNCAGPPVLSIENSIAFGLIGPLKEAFAGVGWSFRTNFGGRGEDRGDNPSNIIGCCKGSVAVACAVVSQVYGTKKGTGPTT